MSRDEWKDRQAAAKDRPFNRVRIAYLFVAFFVAFLISSFLARTRVRSDREAARLDSAGRPDATPGVTDDTDAASEQVSRAPESPLPARGPGESPAKGDAVPVAEQIHREWTRQSRGGTADPKVLGRIGELGPDTADFFISVFVDAQEPDPIALRLALFSGGPAASAFLRDILGRGDEDDPKRRLVLEFVAAHAGEREEIQFETLMGDELGRSAMRLAQAREPLERMAGVAMLRKWPSAQSRDSLMALLEAEESMDIQVAAVAALGDVADRSTGAYLRSYYQRKETVFRGSRAGRLVQIWQEVMIDLMKRFPE